MSWGSGTVIAVMGDSLSVVSISQTNVISDLDTVNGMFRGAGGADNIVSNAASFLTVSTAPESDDTDDAADEEEDAPPRSEWIPFPAIPDGEAPSVWP